MHRAEEMAEDLLVQRPPLRVVGVDDVARIGSSSLLHSLRWSPCRSVEEAMKTGTGEVGKGESLPQHEVAAV